MTKQDKKLRDKVINILIDNAQKIYVGKLPEAVEEPTDQILSKVKEEIERELPKERNADDEVFNLSDADPAVAYELGRIDENNALLKQVKEILDRIL